MEDEKTKDPGESSTQDEDKQQPASEFEIMIERSREWIRKIDAYLANGDGERRPD